MTALAPLRRARVLAAGALAALAVALVAPSASAHDVLIASDPGEGDILTRPPQAITLTFNSNPLEVGSAIVVADGDGETVVEGEGTVEGPDVTLELPAELPSGNYQARWRVASSDGHPIDGVIAFAVDLPEPAAPAEAPTESEAVEEPATTAAQDAPAEAATTPDAEPTPEGSGLSSLPLWLRVTIAIAATASVAGLIIRAVRRQRGDRV